MKTLKKNNYELSFNEENVFQKRYGYFNKYTKQIPLDKITYISIQTSFQIKKFISYVIKSFLFFWLLHAVNVISCQALIYYYKPHSFHDYYEHYRFYSDAQDSNLDILASIFLLSLCPIFLASINRVLFIKSTNGKICSEVGYYEEALNFIEELEKERKNLHNRYLTNPPA